jgi:hypothetical protein
MSIILKESANIFSLPLFFEYFLFDFSAVDKIMIDPIVGRKSSNKLVIHF